MIPPKSPALTIWQWNCRSYRNKRPSLLAYAQQHSPDIIALQEVDAAPITLQGYKSHQTEPTSRTAILIRTAHAVQTHSLPTDLDCTFVELLPPKKTQPSLYILNIYSTPRQPLHGIQALLQTLRQRTRGHRLILLGDFNAPHTAWGYRYDTPKGQRLFHALQQQHFHLCNIPGLPTRIGTSVTRDTTPDLTLTHNVPHAVWSRHDETLGSDHHIIQLTISHYRPKSPSIGTARITNWKEFRKQTPAQKIDCIDTWTTKLLDLCRQHTTTVNLTQESPAADSHLLHIWEARRSLTKRWKRNRTNRKLRIRIAKLTEEAENYARQLSRQNWAEFCVRLQGTLGTRRTWHLLRSLMGKTETKATTHHHIRRLIHSYPGTEDQLLSSLKQSLQEDPTQPPARYPPYKGPPNPSLDAPFTLQELEAALLKLTRNTTPGNDQIPNKLLRNLDHAEIDHLLDYYNHHWAAGTLPQQWRHADITLVPKPNKPITTANLRPISLTSCVGKLLEHMVLNRLTPYIEDNGYLHTTMFGFRPHLSTQDILLQIKADIIDHLTTSSKKSILALDIKGAFDNVTHEAILKGLATTNCGPRMHAYFTAFLQNRTATVRLGHLRSTTFTLRSRGTPQGSVVSPLLFNLAMRELPPLLSAIPTVNHALYADDLTLWVAQGSTGRQQDSLQAAIDVIQEYLQERGLKCAPEKSALITLCARTYKKRTDPIPDPDLFIDNHPVPNVASLRILGLNISKNGSGSSTIPQLQRTLTQLTQLVRRVAHRRFGLQEHDAVRIIQALLTSRLMYGTPYLAIKPAERDKLNVIIRQAYKTALALPPTTSTRKLLQLGIHNTWEELLEAHKLSQQRRLLLTYTGRCTLQRLGYATPPADDCPVGIPPDIRNRITVAPIPRNMHPEYNVARRATRAAALHRLHSTSSITRYTDAARYSTQRAFAVAVVDHRFQQLSAATIRTTTATTAEEAAIALAATTAKDYVTVLSDSQEACRRYLRGRITPTALRILQANYELPDIQLIWAPGHADLPGNDAAHAAACEYARQAVSDRQSPCPDTPLTPPDLLTHYRLSRRRYPPPHPRLSRLEATTLRRLQTNSYPHRTLLHKMYPTQYYATCAYCPSPGTLYHLVWECQQSPSLSPIPNPTYEQWVDRLTSSDLAAQQEVVARARAASQDQGIPD